MTRHFVVARIGALTYMSLRGAFFSPRHYELTPCLCERSEAQSRLERLWTHAVRPKGRRQDVAGQSTLIKLDRHVGLRPPRDDRKVCRCGKRSSPRLCERSEAIHSFIGCMDRHVGLRPPRDDGGVSLRGATRRSNPSVVHQTICSYRSAHFGFMLQISASFCFREPLLSCFSLQIA